LFVNVRRLSGKWRNMPPRGERTQRLAAKPPERLEDKNETSG